MVSRWSRLFLAVCAAAYGYIFMEWLFIITMPSFLKKVTFMQQAQILVSSGAWLTALALAALLPIYALSLLPWLKRWQPALNAAAGLIPTLLLAALSLLMIDNFTYTLFRFGISTSVGIWRGAYALLFLALLGYWLWKMRCFALDERRISHITGRRGWLTGLVLAVALLPLVLGRGGSEEDAPVLIDAQATYRPHIVLVTSDAVDASHLSVYGYERDTTPQLNRLAETALAAENAFSNANKTSGSVISLYTGKPPAQTRLLFPPDILRGEDVYQHLPGILRQQGYRTVQITFPHYVDAETLNLMEGFDLPNDHPDALSLFPRMVSRHFTGDQAYFVEMIVERLADRLEHIFYVRTMINPHKVIAGAPEGLNDDERMQRLLVELRQANRPLFVHIHFLGTHGASYYPKQRVFSAGKTNPKPWDSDLYDDSLLEFDARVGEIIDELTRLGLFDQTLLIVGSDHGRYFSALTRLPLLIQLPAGYSGLDGQMGRRMRVNVQNLDLAPTILDVLGLEKPDWMAGDSLLQPDLPQRPIFIAEALMKNTGQTAAGWIDLQIETLRPPFYQFQAIHVVYCERWYSLELATGRWDFGRIEGHTAPCDVNKQPNHDQVFQWILDYLRKYGFDVSSLEDDSPLYEHEDIR